MNYTGFKYSRSRRVLFVWDGNPDSIELADPIVEELNDVTLHCIYVTPHESIRAYNTVGYRPEVLSSQEKCIHREFARTSQWSKYFKIGIWRSFSEIDYAKWFESPNCSKPNPSSCRISDSQDSPSGYSGISMIEFGKSLIVGLRSIIL